MIFITAKFKVLPEDAESLKAALPKARVSISR